MKKLDIIFITALVTFLLIIAIAYSTSQKGQNELQSNTPTEKVLVEHS